MIVLNCISDSAGKPSTTVYEDVVGGDPGDRLADMVTAGYLPPVEEPKALPIKGGDEEDQLLPDKTFT